MAKQLTPEERNRIEQLEKSYSGHMIRTTNEYLSIKTRLKRIEQWREEQLALAEARLLGKETAK